MANAPQRKQNSSESRQCEGSPVTIPESSSTESATTPPAASSPSPETPSLSSNMPPQPLTSATASTPSRAASLSEPQTLSFIPTASAPESSVLFRDSSSSFTTSPASSAPSSGGIVASIAESTTAASTTLSSTIKSQKKPTRSSSIDLPGFSASPPSSASRAIDIEAAATASTSTSTSTSSAVSPSNEPTPSPANAEKVPSPEAPSVVPSSSTVSSSTATLESEILNPAETGSSELTSIPSTLMTDGTPSTTIIMETSMVFPVTGSESTSLANTSSPGAGGAAPTRSGSGTINNGDLPLQADASPSSPPTSMIIGGALGGATALAVIALLFWLWKRRVQKNMQIGQPRTPLVDRPVNQPSSTMMMQSSASIAAPLASGSFAAGRQASFRSRNPLHGWWASHGAGSAPPLITPEYGEKQEGISPPREPFPARAPPQNPFTDANSVDATTAAATPQQQQRLRGILKQPPPSLYSSNPSDASSIMTAVAAAGVGRRSRAHSVSVPRESQPNNSVPRIPASRRASSLTIEPFEERRNKFRSDPFDLELDTRMLPAAATVPANLAATPTAQPQQPQPQHQQLPQKPSKATRASSVYSGTSSHYTSGMSSNWGDPGVPSALVQDRPGMTDSPTLPQEPRRGGGFGSVVGQAM